MEQSTDSAISLTNLAGQQLKADPLSGNSVDDFRRVAELISSSPPDWLEVHLRRWSSTIFMGRVVEQRQPTRARVVEELTDIKNAAALLERALAEPSMCDFLNAGADRPLDVPYKFQLLVGELRSRADRASRLPNLVDKRGRAKAGRTRAQPDGAISAQIYCVLLIAEAWKWFHDEYPAPRNEKAAKAIDLYWKLAGGNRDNSWGNNPLTAWRYHLKKAMSMPVEKDRAEIRRHMRESARFEKFIKSERGLEGGK